MTERDRFPNRPGASLRRVRCSDKIQDALRPETLRLKPGTLVNDPDCLFCKVAAGHIPAEIVYETDQVIAFRDISPQAPTHVLIIPREHLPSLNSCGDDHVGLLGAVMAAARDVARSEGIADKGYRTVINTGDDGGQTVGHVHLHLLGGRALTWPPG